MKRRTLLIVGAGTGTLLAVAGGTLALPCPGLRDGRLSPAGHEIFAASARGVLDKLLPTDAQARAHVMQAHLARVDDTIEPGRDHE